MILVKLKYFDIDELHLKYDCWYILVIIIFNTHVLVNCHVLDFDKGHVNFVVSVPEFSVLSSTLPHGFQNFSTNGCKNRCQSQSTTGITMQDMQTIFQCIVKLIFCNKWTVPICMHILHNVTSLSSSKHSDRPKSI